MTVTLISKRRELKLERPSSSGRALSIYRGFRRYRSPRCPGQADTCLVFLLLAPWASGSLGFHRQSGLCPQDASTERVKCSGYTTVNQSSAEGETLNNALQITISQNGQGNDKVINVRLATSQAGWLADAWCVSGGCRHCSGSPLQV